MWVWLVLLLANHTAPWDCIRTDLSWKQNAWEAEQKEDRGSVEMKCMPMRIVLAIKLRHSNRHFKYTILISWPARPTCQASQTSQVGAFGGPGYK